METIKSVCNWLTSDIAGQNERELPSEKIGCRKSSRIVEIIDNGTIAQKIGKDVLEIMFDENKTPKRNY